MVDRYTCGRVAEIPRCSSSTFSSTLLDSIYRSIDRGEEDEMVVYRDLLRKKNTDFDADFLWMEKNVPQNVVVRTKNRLNSSSSSSDSSCSGAICGGYFASSEAELQKPKPVRTGKEKLGKSYGNFEINRRDGRGRGDQSDKKSKQEGGFSKTKSRALKLYGDLKKVKEPISPGGKLAGFLNSIFTGAGNLKKSRISGDDSPSLKSNNTSTCSSASSFSRSCLSKTPSSKSSGREKRSVRFFPVSVIVDEDCHITSKYNCQPCGRRSLREETNNKNNKKSALNEELMMHIMEKNLMNYRKKNEIELPFDHFEDEFDGVSCASSDLFELDNLSGIGMEELPVYETTHLDTSRAIANIGLIL